MSDPETSVHVVTAGGEEERISDGLRQLTQAIEQAGGEISAGLLGGEYGYGGSWQVPGVWGMHPYCWCEQEECAWCNPCLCPEQAVSYLVDGEEVQDLDQWDAADASRRSIVEHEDLRCRRCREGREGAANFWHEPSGSKIRWYKYIGRGMDVTLGWPWEKILDECLTSVKQGQDLVRGQEHHAAQDDQSRPGLKAAP